MVDDDVSVEIETFAGCGFVTDLCRSGLAWFLTGRVHRGEVHGTPNLESRGVESQG